MRPRTGVVLLLLALPLAGCLGSPSDAGATLARWAPIADRGTLLEINRTLGPPTGEPLSVVESAVPVTDGERVRLLWAGFGAHLLEVTDASSFPDPLTFPLDAGTSNPIVDGEARPILAPPAPDARTWSVEWGGRTWEMEQVGDGPGTHLHGQAGDASYEIAYEDVPWRPRKLTVTNATGAVVLDVGYLGPHPLEEGTVRRHVAVETLASFQGRVDAMRRADGDRFELPEPLPERTYLFMNVRCRPAEGPLPGAGTVRFAVHQEGPRAEEACRSPQGPRTCRANKALAFDPGALTMEMSQEGVALARMEARAVVYGVTMEPFRIADGQALARPGSAPGEPAEKVDCFGEPDDGQRSMSSPRMSTS